MSCLVSSINEACALSTHHCPLFEICNLCSVIRHAATSIENQQHWQCTYSVTLRRVRGSLLPWKGKKYFLCTCACVRTFCCPVAWACACACLRIVLSSMQRVCAILWRHLWPLLLIHIFRHYLINDAIFGKNFVEYGMCLDLFYNCYLKHFSF